MTGGKNTPAPCSSCSAGYRGPLWASLTNSTADDDRASTAWAFVGTQSNGNFGAPQHEGHPGWTIPQLEKILPSWAATRPDVVLLHAGTNDLGGYVQPVATAVTAAARMRSLLNRTFVALPRVHVILASIIGATSGYGGHQHAAFNAQLPLLVNEFSALNRSIEFLDMAGAAGLGASCDGGHDQLCCPLHIHPNDKGYAAMASVWQRSLLLWASSAHAHQL